MISEKSLLRWFGQFKPPAGRKGDLGIGDDTAVIRWEEGGDLLFACDAVVEGTHFTRQHFSPADVGWKALACTLSDIAAMGGEAVAFTVALGLPEDTGMLWVEEFYSGVQELAQGTGAYLAGGDTVRSPVIFADVAVIGRVERGRAVGRTGARPGDLIFVTGELGLATVRDSLAQRRPRPLLREGRLIAGAGATAMVDLSDGLAAGAWELAKGVRLQLDPEAIPVGKGLSLDAALYGGEDYQLLFTMPTTYVPSFALTVIGEVREGEGVFLGGTSLADGGFDNFASDKDGVRRSHL